MTTRGVAFILSMRNGEVETDSFGKLKCSDSAMLRDLSFYSSRRQPATVVFEKGSRRITSVSSAPTDKVVSISARTPVEEKIAVQLMMRPTLLFLRTSNARFEEFYDMLKKAVAEKRRVHLGVLPGDDVIEDVRVEAVKQ